MKVVVIGGTGLIGSKVVEKLTAHGHEAIAASPNTGVDTLTGDGLAEVLVGADVVVDVSNSPSFEDAAVLDFFRTSTSNLLRAEEAAGVSHHVALSVVGTSRLGESGYFRGKIAQEELIGASTIPFTIVHATQFFEFVGKIALAATDGDIVRVPPVLIRPMAADDVAGAVARAAVGAPVGGVIEVAGPDEFRLDELVRTELEAHDDPRRVVADPQARYFGATLTEKMLLPGTAAESGTVRFADWVQRSLVAG
ncbi:MAG TPA: SDR family oxidoreductase [Acidimicrobiales bacterium]|nr:SDR family oxidoreductase [Acidimicrobiales bacterium]